MEWFPNWSLSVIIIFKMASLLHQLLDPFASEYTSPKLGDGKQHRSSGVRLRATGEITCTVGGVTTLVLLPGLANNLCWFTDLVDPPVFPQAYPGHISTEDDKSVMKMVRLVGAGLKLNMINSADQNEGYWEAVRIPIGSMASFKLTSEVLSTDPGLVYLDPTLYCMTSDISNFASYQTGKIRDLHRYQFKVDSVETEHPFTHVSSATVGASNFVDESFDIVVIKLHGRLEATSPTVVMYEVMSNQEVVYQEQTALARLMTPSPRVPGFVESLENSDFKTPAIQIL